MYNIEGIGREVIESISKRLEEEYNYEIKPLFLKKVMYYGVEYHVTNARLIANEPVILDSKVIQTYEWELTLSKSIGEHIKVRHRGMF